ncbi:MULTISPECIES: hypothetical protein [unclassified Streptomyces]|uniref:hypothetical protein n=1 Tax=unclassified Streptomyces TaxID=2593676 RepID=UPI00225161A7|nr:MULTISPECIES: hypothetical protein [unclassified Streptomyces]MCX5144934.1 hypothetical protein [Streptomyces sp. NBC_00338]WRZ62814.1 hypothetical protein OG408_02520 [Streptomyces sp. NBC_01257]WSU56780.1 hypothetical protein OG450_02480 [Streptomyces sp. NBC_01104]
MTTAIAVLGTLFGSGLTALVAARTERRKTEASERQQVRQEAAQERVQLRELRADHRKWRRDSRQTAYQNLMDSAHEAQGAIWQLAQLTSEPYDQRRYDTRRGAAIDAVRAVRRAANTVQLEGPPGVARAAAECAEAIDQHIHPAITYLMELAAGILDEARRDLYLASAAETAQRVELAQERFAPLACSALDELMDEAEGQV